MKILLIEDIPDIASFIQIGLEAYGHSVDIVSGSSNSEKVIFSGEYDTIILDIEIKGMSGLELLRRIRKIRHSTPLLILTTIDSVYKMADVFCIGFSDYIIKPFSFDQLIGWLSII
jgi:two-component system OmpR family response regulator/two-component system response regulator MprA